MRQTYYTYHRRERLAGRAKDERQARAEAGARLADALARSKHGALYALEHAIRDRGVDGEHETGPEAEPEPRDALLAHDLPRDAEERAVVRPLLLLAGLAFSLATRRAELLPRRDDRHGDREDLRERAGHRTQCELGDGRERCGGRAGGPPCGEALQVRRADEGVEEEIGVFCCGTFGWEGGKGRERGAKKNDVRMEKVLSMVAPKPR